jgi:hypothetical protein
LQRMFLPLVHWNLQWCIWPSHGWPGKTPQMSPRDTQRGR